MSRGNGTGLHLLSKGDILGATDLASDIVEVPEWGGSVRVQGMDVARRLVFSEYLWSIGADGEIKGKPGRSVAVAYAVLCIVDEHGEPLFSIADVDELARKSPAALDRVAAVARRLSGYDTGDSERPLVQTSASPTGSPSLSE